VRPPAPPIYDPAGDNAVIADSATACGNREAAAGRYYRFAARKDDRQQGRSMNRRTMMTSALVLAFLPGRARAAQMVEIEAFDTRGESLGVSSVGKIVRSDAQWREQLSPLAFEITRREGTERAFTGPYWDAHDDGLFRCVCCDTALFDSKTKYDSGTGWPSFFAPISKINVIESADESAGMRRVAVSCKRCDAHLGHVFTDGPKPTGLRYCMNGVALRFAARAA